MPVVAVVIEAVRGSLPKGLALAGIALVIVGVAIVYGPTRGSIAAGHSRHARPRLAELRGPAHGSTTGTDETGRSNIATLLWVYRAR